MANLLWPTAWLHVSRDKHGRRLLFNHLINNDPVCGFDASHAGGDEKLTIYFAWPKQATAFDVQSASSEDVIAAGQQRWSAFTMGKTGKTLIPMLKAILS